MAGAIAQIACLASEIEALDREIGPFNARSALGLGHIPIVLSGAAPAVQTLFHDALIWDAFISVAGLQPPPAPR